MAAARSLALAALLSGVAACGASNSATRCNRGAEGAVEKGARTGVEGAKTGVKTGVEGVKTFGSAVGGLVSGGSDQASANWKNGKDKTRRTAREGADDTQRAAHQCP